MQVSPSRQLTAQHLENVTSPWTLASATPSVRSLSWQTSHMIFSVLIRSAISSSLSMLTAAGWWTPTLTFRCMESPLRNIHPVTPFPTPVPQDMLSELLRQFPSLLYSPPLDQPVANELSTLSVRNLIIWCSLAYWYLVGTTTPLTTMPFLTSTWSNIYRILLPSYSVAPSPER